MKRCSKIAFTIIELLTVIAIEVILCGLLLSALSSAKRQSKIIKCVNNVRQLSFGWAMYAYDYEDVLLINCPLKNLKSKNGALDLWVYGSLRYGWDTWPNNTNTQYLYTNKLSSYINVFEVYKCPSDKTKNLFSLVDDNGKVIRDDNGKGFEQQWLPWYRSVGLNQWMGGINQKLYNVVYHRMSDIDSPSSKFTFVNQRADTYENGYFVTGTVGLFDPLKYKWHEYPSRDHGKITPFAFADGHVERHNWQTKWPKKANLFQTGGRVSSPHNIDIEWINTHSTSARNGNE